MGYPFVQFVVNVDADTFLRELKDILRAYIGRMLPTEYGGEIQLLVLIWAPEQVEVESSIVLHTRWWRNESGRRRPPENYDTGWAFRVERRDSQEEKITKVTMMCGESMIEKYFDQVYQEIDELWETRRVRKGIGKLWTVREGKGDIALPEPEVEPEEPEEPSKHLDQLTPPLPPHGARWTDEDWDRVFDWYYRSPLKELKQLESLLPMAGQTIYNKHREYVAHHGKAPIRRGTNN